MTDKDMIEAIADAIARDTVARNWPSLRKDLIETNVRMIRTGGWGELNPMKLGEMVVNVLRDRGALGPPE